MSYVINYSDPAKSNISITVSDNTLYNGVGTGGLTLVGKNYPGYGQPIAVDLIRLLENFASPSPPINPIEGQLWYDSFSQKLRFNNGTSTNSNWKPINGIYQQNAEPIDAFTGDIWVNTDTNLMKIYSNAQQWLPVGISTSSNDGGLINGAVYRSVTDILTNNHDTITFYLDGLEQAVLTSESFTAVGGFYNSNLNLNFSTGLNLPIGSIINGISDSANFLNQGTTKISGYQFVRNDIPQSINGQLTILEDNNSLKIGKEPTFILERTINGSNANFLNKYPGYGSFTFNITDPQFKNIPVLTIGSNPQQVKILSSQKATSTSTGALVVYGGASIGKDLYIGGQIFANGNPNPLSITYTLPTASIAQLGGVRIDGSSITINGNGIISAPYSYTLPTASVAQLGGVRIDGSSITINGNGVISAPYSYTLPTATTTQLGGVKVDGSSITINGNGIISAPYSYTLPTATTTQLGGVIIPMVDTSGIINSTGILSLAKATTTQLGGVTVDGSTIISNNGVISAVQSALASVPPATTLLLGGVIIPTVSTSGINNSNGTIGLAIANITQLGGVKVDGSSITINGSGVISAPYSYTLPTATTTQLGGVKVDGSSITINGSGQLVATSTIYTLPTATTTQLGGVKVDGSSITINGNGQLVASAYTLPTASVIQLGGVKIGSNISVSGDGTISVSAPYSLPAATSSTLGGVIIPTVSTSGINNSNGTIGLAIASTTQLGGVKVDGNTITVDGSGQLTASPPSIPPATSLLLGGVKIGSNISVSGDGTISVSAPYSLPAATSSTLGGVKIGSNISVSGDGTISVSGVTGATGPTGPIGPTGPTGAQGPAGTGGFLHMITFTSSGSWTIPTGITACKVTVVGGGGGGGAGGAGGCGDGGDGGGAGGTSSFPAVGGTVSATGGGGGGGGFGAGGAGGAAGAGAGGTSNHLTLNSGGFGGYGFGPGGAGGAGGAAIKIITGLTPGDTIVCTVGGAGAGGGGGGGAGGAGGAGSIIIEY